MSRLAAAAIAATLVSAMPAHAAESTSPREMSSSSIGEATIFGKADKQIIGFIPVRVDPNGRWEYEPLYAPLQTENGDRLGNIVGVTASGREVFCFCGAASF